jgi:hypothetical protein
MKRCSSKNRELTFVKYAFCENHITYSFKPFLVGIELTFSQEIWESQI